MMQPPPTDQPTFAKVSVGEVVMPQPSQHLVRPKAFVTHCLAHFNKYVVGIPLSKLNPFTTGAYNNKCINEKHIPPLQIILE